MQIISQFKPCLFKYLLIIMILIINIPTYTAILATVIERLRFELFVIGYDVR